MKCKKIALKRGVMIYFIQTYANPFRVGTDLESRTRESKGREPFGRFKGSGGKRNPPAVFLWDRKPVSFVRTKETGLHEHAPRLQEIYSFYGQPEIKNTSHALGGVAFYSSARRSRYRPYSVIFRPSAVSNS